MKTLEEIQKHVNSAINAYKNSTDRAPIKITDKHTYQEPKLPAYRPAYATTVEWAERINIHVTKGTFPERLFLYRSPNQTDEEYNYTRNNYKQVTLPVAMDYFNTISRCFHDNNWSITYGEEPESQVQAGTNYRTYVTETLPHYGSLETYVKEVVPQIKTVDANGLILVRPKDAPMVQPDDPEAEPQLTGDMLEPIPIFYPSERVINYESDEWALVEMQEKSLVTVGSKQVREGIIYEFADKTNIWRIEQYGKKLDYTFTYRVWYPHNMEAVPFIFLKGVPTEVEGEKVWQSPYMSAIDILDQVLLDSTNLMAVKATCIYPYRIMTGDQCDFKTRVGTGEDARLESCNGRGQIWDPEGRMITCEGCQGSGMKNRMSPHGVLLLKPKTLTEEGDASGAGLSYASPPIDTPEFLRKEINSNLAQARQILHLHTSDSEVQGSEAMATATGMALDLKALYAFIKPISDQIFTLYQFMADTIGFQRYGDDFKKPTIIFPQQFDFYTEAEYLKQISEAIDSGLPSFMVQSGVRNYIESMFFNDESQSRKYGLILHTDRLIHMTPEEITVQNSRGLVENWEVILHDSSLNFIDELIAEAPEGEPFLEQPPQDQKEALIDKAKAKADQATQAQQAGRVPALPPITDEGDGDDQEPPNPDTPEA